MRYGHENSFSLNTILIYTIHMFNRPGIRPEPFAEMDLSLASPAPDHATNTSASAAFRSMLIETFQQMMYVSGETAEPSVETTSIIEDIVRQQVIELVGIIPLPCTAVTCADDET
jgi:hypothetical protein